MDPAQIIVAAACLVLVWALVTYNLFARARSKVRAAWRDLQAQLKRRHDLVPSLNRLAREYAGHDRDELRAVAAGRSQAIAAQRPVDAQGTENSLAREIGDVLALGLEFPSFRADPEFSAIADAFAETDDAIQTATLLYNTAAERYNAHSRRFPNSLIAGWMHPHAFGHLHLIVVDFVPEAPLMRELTA